VPISHFDDSVNLRTQLFIRSTLRCLTFVLLFAGSLNAQGVAVDTMRLRPGDALQITVWRDAELSGTFVIGSDARLKHPLYAAVDLRDASLADARTRVRSFLEPYKGSDVRVFVDPLVSVTVSGEVRTPGLLLVPAATTVSNAVARAGGVTPNARWERVTLVRNGAATRIDMTSDAASGPAATLFSGDHLIVDRRTSFFREYLAPAASIVTAIGVFARAVIN
jgi:protein involved in polysaccharide export with SLBB domain